MSYLLDSPSLMFTVRALWRPVGENWGRLTIAAEHPSAERSDMILCRELLAYSRPSANGAESIPLMITAITKQLLQEHGARVTLGHVAFGVPRDLGLFENYMEDDVLVTAAVTVFSGLTVYWDICRESGYNRYKLVAVS